MRSSLTFVVLALCLAISSREIAAQDAGQPNVVLILADDLGYGDPGCYNPDSKIPTPNLDRLAREGMRFTDAHSPSSVCTPTRYGILTGRYCWRSRLKSGVLGNGYARTLIEEDRPTIASVLRDAGYRTAAVGKWHLGLDWQSTDGSVITGSDYERIDYSVLAQGGAIGAGFDSSFLIPASLDMAPYCFVRDGMAEPAPTEQIEASHHRRQNGNGYWRGGAAAPEFDHTEVLPQLAKEAVAQLGGAGPFLLYFPLTAPHTPWVPTDEFRGATTVDYYGDFVAQVDATIGMVLDEIDRLDIAGNTLVIVTSDNGSHWPVGDIAKYGHRANGPWRGQKADIHDGGHRVPLIVRWPGRVEAGGVNDDLVCLTDLYATIASATGAETPYGSGEDSIDHTSRWWGNAHAERRDHVVHHSHRGMFAIRRGPWKLIVGQGSGGFTQPSGPVVSEDEPPGQLFHLQSDPTESRNLYRESQDIVGELDRLLSEVKAGVVVDDND